MIKTEFLLAMSIQYQADKWWEQRNISRRGFLVDPLPNSQNQHHKNCIADSTENYWWDLGSERVKNRFYLLSPLHLQLLGVASILFFPTITPLNQIFRSQE